MNALWKQEFARQVLMVIFGLRRHDNGQAVEMTAS